MMCHRMIRSIFRFPYEICVPFLGIDDNKDRIQEFFYEENFNVFLQNETTWVFSCIDISFEYRLFFCIDCEPNISASDRSSVWNFRMQKKNIFHYKKWSKNVEHEPNSWWRYFHYNDLYARVPWNLMHELRCTKLIFRFF